TTCEFWVGIMPNDFVLSVTVLYASQPSAVVLALINSFSHRKSDTPSGTITFLFISASQTSFLYREYNRINEFDSGSASNLVNRGVTERTPFLLLRIRISCGL